MSEEVKRKKRVIEEEVVELKIQLSEAFFDNMVKAKKQVAEARGFDVTYGEYIEEAMDDLVKMVNKMSKEIVRLSATKEAQDLIPSVVEKSKDEPKEHEETLEDVPEDLYAHIIKDEDKHTMYQ